ncbi:chitosanase [Paenibacillus sp. PvR133]|jgi:chitosanase|uniref:chitosanase n=1 Tax=Paenibacillus sp. PvR133 TaxID=2806598 RepID=UPI001AEB8A44|nr:chitosanase [Paenibacillus sp. PvR133]MBP1177609.1 chitosanase [Paenibacillus sp. PvR133]
MYKISNKLISNKTKFLMILLSFTVIASFSSLSGPPAKAFAEENGTPVQKTIDLNEGFNNSNEASIEPLSLTSEAATSQEAVTAIDHDANFSPSTLQFLKANTGLDGEQWDNIMKLVNKPEQDSLKWTEFYGYAEDIGDNRGYTIGIFGATTGGSNDTGPDGPDLFKAFDAASGASNPSIAGGLTRAGLKGKMSGSILKLSDSDSVIKKKINALQNNEAWREAMWRTFYDTYIEYSVQQAQKRGFNTALTIGSFVDTALNQGATGDSGSLEGILSRSGSSTNEKKFMTSFYAKRTLVVDTNDYNQPPNGKNRVKQWSSLLASGETDLKNADAAVIKATNWELK